MHPHGASVAAHRGVFKSRDTDFTREFMASKDFFLDLDPREKSSFDFVAAVAYLPNGYVGTIGYGSVASVRAVEDRKRDDYFVHLPICGRAVVTNRAGSSACVAGQGVISSPAGHLTRSESSSARITISLTKAAVVAHLATLLGDAPRELLEFAPGIDLDSTAGRRFERHARMVLAELDDADAGPSPIMLAAYEDILLTGLILGQPNNYAEALVRLEATAAPAKLRRALDFMHAHLDMPIRLSDIVEASGMPGRTLMKHFRDSRGVSPMRYLRTARLTRVRANLLDARSDESVTDLAMRWGFFHLGRFAAEYRRHFGESPSETRRRGRGDRRR